MKNFTFKLLQQLNKKKADKGFTLIELLVVIIIIGILSAIALPAFLNQAAKAKQSEAKQTLGALNRGQQAYRLEEPAFAPRIDLLALGVDDSTNNFSYGIGTSAPLPASGLASFSSADGTNISTTPGNASVTVAAIRALAVDPQSVRSYAAAAATSVDDESNSTTITILCEGIDPGDSPTLQYNATATPPSLACAGDSEEL
ncbi:prepilin-type N-terminal cleavage/methylation domain-containing protein [Picosynechococcus sp. PCC 11901]|uniref:type IV pilin-like G/H family protein n=1 Tax=Picosynechococcus sp. PCC 11901 TaxID=2579791 RepID=UPI0010FBFBD2|nr:type IV pilin-like G/H family protein [Picosynechococcus sp. PCC 11901]QCS48602.1 prepilin-type N-terminal cleavage/methylation domain-containing protein [Picosynechococcus sp. PCC 11901]